MRTGDRLNTIRLLPAEPDDISPVGMVVSGESVAKLARSLAARAKHYSTLRVTRFQSRLVFWSIDEDVKLPWAVKVDAYLSQSNKLVFYPVAFQPDLPGKWTEPLIDRLVRDKSISSPVLLLPSDGEVIALGLGANSCPVNYVDWNVLVSAYG